MSVDPYMRVRMAATLPNYPSWELGAVMDGSAIGVVEASGDGSLAEGTVVSHRYGWRDHALVPLTEVRPIAVDPAIPLTAHLDVLGMTGLTAYVGLRDVARLQPGEDVWVSGAAGAVGAACGQLARLLGAGRVIGSAGSPEKVRQLTDELGYDAAFDYHVPELTAALLEVAPAGIDVYFDNVGDDHLAAALDVIRPHGRIVVCGAINQYNQLGERPGPHNLINVLTQRLRVEGFTVREHLASYEAFVERASEWMRQGRLTSAVTVAEGLDHAVHAFREMLRGANRGKMLVRVSEDP
ncbi:NADP-dependent oxidoreductase [Nocardioides halotolerans]|uniref:NADP-dependent oxidoreductase n=1 Tax=Nocardioides halotolerans TaxID=433660 RepID=UPI00041AE472|nr:NADP-dependent oxidoreductase [Nocardioides halotolerans]